MHAVSSLLENLHASCLARHFAECINNGSALNFSVPSLSSKLDTETPLSQSKPYQVVKMGKGTETSLFAVATAVPLTAVTVIFPHVWVATVRVFACVVREK
mmetsp:Transcript_4050/g.6425  ORF Transcript_4050/g.6425 Transcript_4050/m.6425 type:complete len:101 (+) Transcript_4050:337-639(+)